jgi:hypothetical protein
MRVVTRVVLIAGGLLLVRPMPAAADTPGYDVTQGSQSTQSSAGVGKWNDSNRWTETNRTKEDMEAKFSESSVANKFQNLMPSERWSERSLDGAFKRNAGRLPNPPGGVPRPKKISPNVSQKFKKSQEKMDRMFSNTKGSRKIKLH